MSKFFEVINLDKFQHYKDRTPPWIKLYNDLLDNYEFSCLQDASKLHLIMIWLLASRSDNKIPYDSKWVGNRINATSKVDLDELQRAGFIRLIADASNPLAEVVQDARPEREGETENKKNKKEKVNLLTLSVEHISEWLAQKRLEGKYIKHDEHEVLEIFKNYCQANGKSYTDYVAAYRNAFAWDQCKPKGNYEKHSGNNRQNGFSGGRKSQTERISDSIAEFAEELGISGKQI